MNRIGMLVDLPTSPPTTMRDALEVTASGVVHSLGGDA